MGYDEFKQLCRDFREEEYNYLRFDRSKLREQGRQCFCNENKNTFVECTQETKLFQFTEMLY